MVNDPAFTEIHAPVSAAADMRKSYDSPSKAAKLSIMTAVRT
jgi:hypothetical protein